MDMNTQLKIVAVVLLAAVTAGCAQGLGGGAYSRDEARREQNVRMGIVESVRPVQIEGTRTGVGPAAGAVVGGVAGSTIGGGRGSAVAAVLGAVAGGVPARRSSRARRARTASKSRSSSTAVRWWLSCRKPTRPSGPVTAYAYCPTVALRASRIELSLV